MPDIYMDVDIALSEVPVNIMSLIDDTDFKTREVAITYDQAGMDLVWNFVTTGGAFTQTAVTPTTGGNYDWTHQGDGIYTIEIPASGGISINNDTEGFGWFSGICTGVMPWRGPVIGFRAATLNNALIDGGDTLDVNVTAIADTAQTANDNGADINTLLTRIVGTLASGTHNAQSGDSFARIGVNGAGLTNINLPDQTMNIIGSITGNLSGSVGSVTAEVSADVVKISGDSISADNLELQYDGTGIVGDTFPATQTQLRNIVSTGASVNKTAESYTLTTGIQSSGTIANTIPLDGTNHEHTDTAGAMDLYYEFNIGSGIPVSCVTHGYLNGLNDNLEVYGYDWSLTSWVKIGTMIGKATATNEVNNYDLFVNMVGTGVNLGKVRVRFTDGAYTLSSATLAIDQIFISFSQSLAGYADGSIWVDSSITNTGTIPGVDGVATNPVSTWAAALTLSGLLNIKEFHIANGTTITLTGNSDNFSLIGHNWYLALGGQNIDAIYIEGADVSGIGTNGVTAPKFVECHIGDVSLPPSHLNGCALTGTYTATSAGTFYFEKCISGIAGTSAPVFDFGSALNSSDVNFRDYSGGIEIQNMGAGTGTYSMTLEGKGQLIINANCSATSNIAIRGLFTITDNSGGAVTLSNDAMFDSTQLVDDIWDEVLTAATHNVATSAGRRLRDITSDVILTGTSPNTGGTGNTAIRIELDGSASSTDAAYDPGIVIITAGTGLGQSRQIFEYDGVNKYAYINRSWKVIPDNTSEYIVVGSSGNTHVNEGVVTGGGDLTVTLNALASSVNETYTGQCIFLHAGIGEDQNRYISAYDGATKVATVDRAWATNPVAGQTIYSILPHADMVAITKHLFDMKGTGFVKDTHSLTDIITGTTAIKAKTDNLPSGVAKNVALANFPFMMVDSTDHVTPRTLLTVTATISKDGGAFTACTNAVVEISNGMYKISLTQTEMNADIIVLKFTASGADQRTIVITTS